MAWARRSATAPFSCYVSKALDSFEGIIRSGQLQIAVAKCLLQQLKSAAPFRGTKRARLMSQNLPAPKSQSAPHTLPGQSPKYSLDDLQALRFRYIQILRPLFSLTNILNFGSPKVPQNLKTNVLGTCLAIPFCIRFLYISPLPEHCCFATSA